jgi:hypothetical protein
LIKLEKEVNKMPGDVAQETPAIDMGKDLDDTQKMKVNALMDYIATTPQNINYNIVREISKAVVLNEHHPYFEYYAKKIKPKTKPVEQDDEAIGALANP